MSTLRVIIAVVAALALFTTPAAAAPFNAEDKNPQVVAYYPDGTHGVVGENATHTGEDLVMKAGNSGVFQQWFLGVATEGPNETLISEGDHSVWMESKDGTCPNNWYKLENVNTSPDRFWGDYLTTGATYCIHTNDFKADQH